MDGKTLQELKRVNIKEVNPDELVDISEIEIDTKQSVQKRVKEYVEQVHNPYLVRVGEYVVRVGYSVCDETVYFKNCRNKILKISTDSLQ